MEYNTFTEPGVYTDSNHPAVIAYAESMTKGKTTMQEKMIALYYAVRDGFRYNPYHIVLKPYALKASYLLTKDYGYCVEKSNLFAACARVLGVPSRLGFSNVRNHLGTGKIEDYLGTDVLAFHGFAEIYLNGKWIKVTPVFNKELCDKYGVDSLEFDGKNDAVFQVSDKSGRPFMEYVADHGVFSDVPVERFEAELRKQYPHLFKEPIKNSRFILEFEN